VEEEIYLLIYHLQKEQGYGIKFVIFYIKNKSHVFIRRFVDIMKNKLFTWGKFFQYLINDYSISPNSFCGFYQNKCRIYLDEYPEQLELRKEWFINFGFLNCLETAMLNTSILFNNFIEKIIDIAILNSLNKDTYFENRWLRRK